MPYSEKSHSIGHDATSLPFAGPTEGYPGRMLAGCVVLQYTRVAALIHDPLQSSVQPYHFEQQMEYLAEDYNVLSADELEYRLTRGKSFLPRSVILMFDGGYADLLCTVKGVLDRLSLPATAFVPTAGLLEKGLRWYDELEDLLIAERGSGECELIVDDEVLNVSAHTHYERFVAYNRLISLLSRKSPAEQREILSQLAGALNPCEGEADNHPVLDAQQLRQLGPIRLACSTHHHVDPDTLSPQEQMLEIGKDKEILEEITGRQINHFSWPFWAIHGPFPTSADVLWELGFSVGFRNMPGSAVVCTKSDQFVLPRVRVCDTSPVGLHRQLGMLSQPSMRRGMHCEDQTTYRR
jgi:peptidoglycan/xylan/chitin deacetylase (PgdA/CDA1 family)